ncbi:hypothetical protein ACMHYJ_10680 [Castellaniella hirudinis]|uniref:hypothetical protein n=1 Tax=Castellaniella hirudinis TaxID=1144617 RepID=UPI0039C0DBC9
MGRELFDRELETKEILRILRENPYRPVTVLGNSGVGKSVLVKKCLNEASLNTIFFSFKPKNPNQNTSLSSFLVDLKKRNNPFSLERNLRVGIDKIGLGIPSLLGAYFKVVPGAIDENYCESLFKCLFQAGYRALCIENIELCRDPADIQVLCALGNLASQNIRIIFEVGTLEKISHEIRHISKAQIHRGIFELSEFDREKTLEFHRFLHHAEPPPDLFKRTHGLPLAVEYQASVDADEFNLSWVDKKLKELDQSCWEMAYILSSLEEPCPVSYFSKVYEKSDFESVFMRLLRSNICKENEAGIMFCHPSFRLVVRRNPSAHMDRKILLKTLTHLESLSDQSIEHSLSVVRVAQKLNNEDAVTFHGLRGLVNAYRNQNAAEIFHFADALLSKGKLSVRQERIVKMVEIQALNQLMRSDVAVAKLDAAEELLSGDPRTVVLRAMALHQCNDAETSNALIDGCLSDLDPRSAVVALAIKIANDIKLDHKEQAWVFFEDAVARAARFGFADLSEELARLNAKLVSPPELAIERMRDHLAQPAATGVGQARLAHNLGVQEMLISDGVEGVGRLQAAQEIFQRDNPVSVTYSAVCLAVADVARGEIDQAIERLVDAQCLCREQYDRFGMLNNLGCCFMLVGNHEKAKNALEEAGKILMASPIPLGDRLLHNCLYENMALVYLKLGRFTTAHEKIERVVPLQFARRLAEREARHSAIKAAITRRDQAIGLEKKDYDKAAWLYTRFLPNLMTLSFYDYPFHVISQDEVVSLQSTCH